VDRYDLEFYHLGAAQPFQTTPLGMPLVDVDGKVRVDLATVLSAWPPPGAVYEAAVSAVGPLPPPVTRSPLRGGRARLG
jgi:hypothetical protein